MASGFEMRSLIIIVPFAFAFLIGLLCICRHKIFLWTLKKGPESESETAGTKAGLEKGSKNGSKNAVQYDAPSDTESGNRAESESDSILMPEGEKRCQPR